MSKTPSFSPPQPLPIVGIDLAKASFDLCLLHGEDRRRGHFPNTPAGCQQFLAWLSQAGLAQVLCALEATGPYGTGLAKAAFAAGHQVLVFNPRRVVEFARSTGRRNKTDRVDAELIAHFAASLPPQRRPLWQPLPPAQEELQALLRRQADLEQQIHGEECRLAVAAPAVQASLRRSVRWLQHELARLEKAVQAHLAAHPGLQADVDRLQAIAGVGEKTARLLSAELPRHFRHARAVAAWLGVVPRQVQSGTSVRKGAHVGHEAPSLRSKLYFPALTALRYDPRSRAFAERLRAAGKPPKSIILAVLHKLVRTAFALLKTGSTYQPEHLPAQALRPCSP